MRLIFFFFFLEHQKFHVDFKNLNKITSKGFGFLDHLILIGNCKFSLLLRQYSYFPVNVLSSGPKISDLIENNFF